MDNLERCGSPIDFRLTDIFVSLKRTNLFFFTDLYLLSNRSWHYISLCRTMSLQTPNQSMQMYCSVTTHPPAVPPEDISSLQRSWSEHPDWIRLLEIYIFITWQGSLKYIRAFWLIFPRSGFCHTSLIAHFAEMPSRTTANWNLSETSKRHACQSCSFCWFLILGPLCFQLEERLLQKPSFRSLYVQETDSQIKN